VWLYGVQDLAWWWRSPKLVIDNWTPASITGGASVSGEQEIKADFLSLPLQRTGMFPVAEKNL
jgi:hypothetical protein